MIDRSVGSMALLAGWLMAGVCSAGESVHWSYHGETGPKHWGELSEDFAACSNGKNQSPIDIDSDALVPSKLGALELDYSGNTTEIINNGHTIQLGVEPGNMMRAEGEVYQLLQFHMHSPSENTIDGKIFPLELHFVHQNSSGELAVLGVLFREGDENERVGNIEDFAPAAGGTVPHVVKIADVVTVKEVPNYYRYNGSLTTPPCSEGLRWYLYPGVATVSRDQIAQFVKLIGHNARPVQPHNARLMLEVE